MTESSTTKPAFPYTYFWNRMGRKGQPCAVLARGKMNSCLVAFQDKFRMVTSRNAIRKMKRGVIRNAVGKFVKVPVDPNVTTRICWCCQQEKDLSLFGKDKTGLLGKKGKCKKCESDDYQSLQQKEPG
jgi:hypothetical protein